MSHVRSVTYVSGPDTGFWQPDNCEIPWWHAHLTRKSGDAISSPPPQAAFKLL